MHHCSLFLIFLISVNPSHARTFSEIQKEGVLQVATEGAFPPFNLVKNNEPVGFEIDLVNEMAKRMGLKTKWQTKGFDGLLIGLQQDRYDLVAASHAVTRERQEVVNFLPPHYCSGGVIVSLKGGPSGLSELPSKKVGVQVSSIYPKFLETRVPSAVIRTYPTDPDVIQALLLHKIDAAITDRFLAVRMTSAHPELQVGEVANPERNAMALKRGNSELHARLKRALDSIFADGTYEKLSKRYFHEDIRCKE